MKKLLAKIVSVGVLSAFLVGCGSGITEETKPNPAPSERTNVNTQRDGKTGGMIPDFTDDGVGRK